MRQALRPFVALPGKSDLSDVTVNRFSPKNVVVGRLAILNIKAPTTEATALGD
jgi:hypothetical protein